MIFHSFLVQGVEVQPIEVQVHFRFQIPSFQILGLAGPEIQEARERIIAAFASSEIEFMKKKVIVNLAPSDLRKSGTGHDLAIALGVISKTDPDFHHYAETESPEVQWYAWGTLALDGRVLPSGKMASLMDLLSRDSNRKIVYLSPSDARDLSELDDWRREKGLSTIQNVEVRIVRRLKDVVHPPKGALVLPKRRYSEEIPDLLPLMSHQERVIDLSIVGRHHSLILGPKGIGKSQMLEWYRWLAPEHDPAKSWRRFLYEDSASVGSLGDRAGLQPWSRSFPLRSVHAQVKPAHLLGSWGPKGFRAGELSLAHGGILIADEFLEWHRDSKECLREPLQNKHTSITRVQGTTEVECDFQLIATGNLCPCGGLPNRFREKGGVGAVTRPQLFPCSCRPSKVDEYLARLSGPIAERIDLITVFMQDPSLTQSRFTGPVSIEAIQEKKASLIRKQKFAIQKFGAIPSELSVRWLETNLPADPMFEMALKGRQMSLRSRHKVLRLARTIQALDECDELTVEHVMEAISCRMPDQL